MIKVTVQYNNHSVDIHFPCSETTLYSALMEIDAADDTPPELFIKDVVFPEELDHLKDRFVNLDELNYLAKRMESFFGTEEEQFYEYAKYALLCGTAPVVPHFYALCLHDDDPKEREIGMAAGLSLLWFCDELWVFGDRVTHGMEKEIHYAKNLNIHTVYIKESQVKNTLKKQGGNYYA